MADRIRLNTVYNLNVNEPDDKAQCVIPLTSLGFGEIFEIERESDGATGLIIFQPNGKWWWIRHPDTDEDEPNPPWQPG